MSKKVIKPIVLIVVFIAALITFCITTNKGNKDMTTKQADATLPVMSFNLDKIKINTLHGYTLKSVFKAVYGMPIASYMKEYRMKSASNMLLHEDKSISEIAAAVGYKSQSKFTSAFRDIFQILPTAYQKLYRNQ